jgi:guanine deaminase
MARPASSVVIRGGLLVDAAARAALPADILIVGDTVAEVGAPGLAAPPDARRVDATDRLLIPGLINAHTHSHANLPRSAGDRVTLELALHLNPAIRGNQTAEDKYLAALLGAAEMIRKGCTACYDLFYEFPSPSMEGVEVVAQAYLDAGMRAVIAPMLASHSLYRAVPGLLDAIPEPHRARLAGGDPSAADAANLAVSRRLLERWRFDRDRVLPALAPTIPLHCSDALWREAAALARAHGAGLHTHLAESKVQALAGMERYGRTLTAHLQALGVLGPNFTAAHGVWLDDDDVRRLADAGASVVHNPGSNMRYGSGLAAVRRMLDGGLNVGIGTDSRSCSDNLNMFEAMRLASFTSRARGPDYRRWLGTEEVFAMATEGSARALGFAGRLGRIAPGYKADTVFLDRRNMNYVPLNDVTSQIVNAEDGTAVDSVMIGGRMVLDHGRFTTLDYHGLAGRAERAMERLRNVNAEARDLARRLEPVVGSFCMALACHPYHVQRFVADDPTDPRTG